MKITRLIATKQKITVKNENGKVVKVFRNAMTAIKLH